MKPEKLYLTEHAIDRYLERWRPGWTREQAQAEIEAALPRATYVETRDGDLFYDTPRGARLVVASDGAVRTVLPEGSQPPDRRPRKARGRR